MNLGNEQSYWLLEHKRIYNIFQQMMREGNQNINNVRAKDL